MSRGDCDVDQYLVTRFMSVVTHSVVFFFESKEKPGKALYHEALLICSLILELIRQIIMDYCNSHIYE